MIGPFGRELWVHELTLAQSLVEAVLREADSAKVARRATSAGTEERQVVAVRVTVGGLTHVEPENLKFWYEELTKGTRLAGSALLVEKRPTVVRCQRCGGEFAVVANSFVCAACGVADVRLATGDEVILESIEVQE